MFKSFTPKLFVNLAFWFVTFCVGCLVYAATSFYLFDHLADNWVYYPAMIGLLWCIFAGVSSVFYIAFQEVKVLFKLK